MTRRDRPTVGPTVMSRESATGAAMNAILTFPNALTAELTQLWCEVEFHQREVAVEAAAFEQSRSLMVARESDISRRMNTLRQRLAGLLV